MKKIMMQGIVIPKETQTFKYKITDSYEYNKLLIENLELQKQVKELTQELKKLKFEK